MKGFLLRLFVTDITDTADHIGQVLGSIFFSPPKDAQGKVPPLIVLVSFLPARRFCFLIVSLFGSILRPHLYSFACS